MSSLSNFFLGKEGQFQQLPTMTGGQQNLLSQLLSGLGGATGAGLGNLQQLLSGDTQAFEAPLMRQFQEEIVPGIAERFTGAGAGAQSSSAFQQALGSAGAGLAEQLGAMRGGLQMQGLGQLSQMLGLGLGAKPFENIYQPGTSGFLGGMAPGIGQAIGMGAIGSLPKIGSGISSLWNLISRTGGSGLRPGEMYSPGSGYQWA